MKQFTMLSGVDMLTELSFLEAELAITKQENALEIVKELRESVLKDINKEYSVANTMFLLATKLNLSYIKKLTDKN
jgi:hypothetical protein